MSGIPPIAVSIWCRLAETWCGLIVAKKPRAVGRRPISKIEHLEDRRLLTFNPPIATNDNFVTSMNTPLQGVSVLFNDFDVDHDIVDQAQLQSGVSHGRLTLNLNGTFTYIPNPGFNGIDSFTYFARDSAHGESSSNAAIVSIQVGMFVPQPVAFPAVFATNANSVLAGQLTGSDPANLPLIFVNGFIAPLNGQLFLNSNGSFTYRPQPGFTGTDYFSFVVSNGSITSPEALVEVDVGSTSGTAPVANSATFTTPVETRLHAALTGSDADGDTLTFTLGALPPDHGTVSISLTGQLTYIPDAGFSGDDFFTFKVSDGTVNSVDALVTVHVAGLPNEAPTVISGSAATDQNVAFAGSLSPLGSDAEGNPLTFRTIAKPVHGAVSLNPDGTFTYRPTIGYSGPDQFTFMAHDGHSSSNLSTFQLAVNPVTNQFELQVTGAPGIIVTKSKSATSLDPAASVTNLTPSAVFGNASLEAGVLTGRDRHDQFMIAEGTTISGVITTRGQRVYLNGLLIAQVESDRQAQTYQLKFTSSATVEAVNATLQRLTFRNAKQQGTQTRVVQLKLRAGGAVSSAAIEANLV